MSAPPAPARPPGEVAGLVQVPRLLWHLPGLLLHRRGRTRTVVVLPGRSTDDISTLPLRLYLRSRGHRVRGWGLGPNHGRVDELLPLALAAVRDLATSAATPVDLVGQSLGGYLAREVARQAPAEVGRVITLGAPIFGRRDPAPLSVPVTAVHSPIDRVVPPGRAIDRDPATTNLEVGSTHFSMGIDPDVWRIVADALEEEA
ncbi:hypothetical protein PO878_05685 [Iamia majanohamensis]|uniref:Alpha/beta hydrolase n=1 Tax=Iamia majanohamensis TaxID=467976 RepID=A0AAE9YI29_9ACTN|nr:hypothetical protein [Iamia majanohamensis]WCO68216.1 hypothetical protein PO878_05685 [Iamia majanohamensis]